MGRIRFSRAIATLIGIMILMLTFGVKAQVVPEHYIVTFNSNVRTPDIEADTIARANGFDVGYVYSYALKGFSARIPDRALAAVQRNPRVASVEPDIMMHAFAQTLPTGIDRIDAELSGASNVDVDIAIIDTGIDIDHPDLNVVGGTHFYTNFLGRIIRQDDNYNDDNGHGTHVSGTAAAIDNDTGVVGVAPGARVWAVKVLDQYGSGYLSAIIAGIDWVTARADTIEVANMSLGGTGLSSAYRTAIANSVAAGIVYVAAAGNESMDVYGTDGVFNSGSDILPAAYPEVMTVSALADSDGQPGGTGGPTSYGSYPDDSFAGFSNYSNSVVAGNPVNSPGKAIDLMMPGVDINSSLPGGGYGAKSGTSMASPHAAGLVALYIAQNGRANNAADVYAIRQALIDSGMNQASGKRLFYPATEPDSYPENLGWAGPAGDYYAVEVTPASQSDSGAPNDIIEYVYTVTNTGTLADNYNISTSSTWGSSVEPITLNLDPGAFGTVTVSHTIPGGASNGDNDTGTLNVEDSGASDSATFTTTAVVPGANEMHVASIGMNGQSQWRRWAASAAVNVVDTNSDPVAGATVYGTWSGAYSGNVSGATNGSGLVTFSTSYIRNGGTFTFTVTNIVKTDWTYNAAANVETSDFITLTGAPELLGETSLEAPFPSPGNPEMWIPFRLSQAEQVAIKIYDVSGRLVRTLDLGSKSPGAYIDKEKAAYWDGRNNSGEEINSGIYFCVMEAGSFRASKKILIAK